MKKFKKLISTVTLFAFCTLSYSPAFASVATEQPTMDEYAPQEITEIIVKDLETKAWLESEESPYSDIPVTLVDEFPADVEAEFDAMLSETGNDEVAAVLEDGVEPANVIVLGPLVQWLSNALYAALATAGLIYLFDGIEFAKVEDIAIELERDDTSDYYATKFERFTKCVYIGEAISLSKAVNIIIDSVELGRESTEPASWNHFGNVMCKDNTAALTLCSLYQSITQGTIDGPEYHGDDECGNYAHYHVGKSGVNLSKPINRTAHVWFYMYEPTGINE